MRILSFRILIFCIKKTTCYSSNYKKLKLIELQKIKMKKYQKYHISYKIFQFNSIKFLTNKINCAVISYIYYLFLLHNILKAIY